MQVTIQLEYKADRKEQLGAMLRRVAAAFDAAGLSPSITASFSDGPVPGGTSAIDRALKKHPGMARFESTVTVVPDRPPIRRLASGPTGPFPLEAVLALADGVPRSLPFHSVLVYFAHPAFGDVTAHGSGVSPVGGVIVGDSWWVSGRNRSLSAAYTVQAERATKSLPPPPADVAAVLTALGKPRKSSQFVAPGGGAAPEHAAVSALAPTADVSKIGPIVARYRADMAGMLGRLRLPHDLPPLQAALGSAGSGSSAGPLKPALVAAFGPRGYDCRGDHGVFTLRRHTVDHHVVDLVLDVGTWSRMVTAIYVVHGPGFKASVPVPVASSAVGALQYPIGDADNWGRIVANLAVIVDELDRTMLPEIEAAAGPAPEWFEPGR